MFRMAKSVGRAALLAAMCFAAGVPALASRQFTDEKGRRITVPDNPQRVICLAPSLTEMTYALGLGNIIVGVTDFTDDPPEAQKKPSVGNLTGPSFEKIISLRPDLILAAAGLNERSTVEQLDHLGLPVFVVDPHTLDDILASVQRVGDVLNRSREATELVQRLQHQRAAVGARVQGLPRLKVLVLVWYDPVISAGGKSYVTDVIRAAGAESVTADLNQVWPEISMEEVIRRAPDYLLLVQANHGGVSLKDLKGRAGWDQLPAVKQGHVIYIGERLIRPSPVVFDALEQLAKQLHPRAFESGRGDR